MTKSSSHPTHTHTLFSKMKDVNTVRDTLKMVENSIFEQLVDFDNHLDNVSLDWTNPDINRALPTGGN